MSQQASAERTSGVGNGGSAAPAASRPRAAHFSRPVRFIVGLTLLIIGTVMALRQDPVPDPWRPLRGWEWWHSPIERNAWRRLPTIDSDLMCLFALSAEERIWVGGSEGFLAYSENGGHDWVQGRIEDRPQQLSQLPPTNPTAGTGLFGVPTAVWSALQIEGPNTAAMLRAIAQVDSQSAQPLLSALCFIGAQRGWAVGTKGAILTTRDGGASWQWQTTDTHAQLTAIQMMPDGGRGWAVGGEGTVLVTSDGGTAWHQRTSGTSESLNSLQMLLDGQRGWAAGNHGTILVTNDGGASWRSQDSGTDHSLRSLQMLADGQRGWVAGDSGTILVTRDGGASWQAQASGTYNSIESLQMLSDGQYGWAAGDNGLMLTTRDGGASWQTLTSNTYLPLCAIRMSPDGRRGWATGIVGAILITRDGGASWQPQTSSFNASLASVRMLPDGRRGWIVQSGGTILVTHDGGSSWRPQAYLPRNQLSTLDMLQDGRRGWATGRLGTILATHDGGNSWQPQTADSLASFSALQMLPDGLRGWAAGYDGAIYATRDGGNSWQAQDSGTHRWLLSLQMLPDGRRGWTAGISGTILVTSDGGASWRPQASGTSAWIHALQLLPDGQHGWAVGDSGTVLSTRDGGVSWQPQTSGTQNRLLALHMLADGRRGWAAGVLGTILTTRDGGASWQPQSSGTGASLRSLQMLNDGQRGWVVGTNGTILVTRDGGVHWSPPRYARYPAPWFFVLLLLTALVLAPVLRPPAPVLTGKPSIADLLASDRPIKEGDPDPLRFHEVAGGIARFLANENTEPPLTLAITGRWGSGKSSIMNLVRAALKPYGFRTVWFNAWHHQTEEHLLASLMADIERQAVPRVWTPVGLVFRFHLLFARGARQAVPALLLLLLFTVLASWIAEDPVERLNVAAALFTKNRADVSRSLGSLLALLLAVGTPLFAIGRGISTFGMSPSRLISLLTGRFHIGGTHGDTGLRHRFALTFGDVTRSLRPNRMVIFIDDLDRCQPDNVVRVLDLTNFLASSGNCFVILGISPEWVLPAVALQYSQIAAEQVDGRIAEAITNGEKVAREQRRQFAVRYLEKIINIEIPVPVRTSREAEGLVEPPPKVQNERTNWPDLRRRAAAMIAKYSPIALALMVSLAGIKAGRDWLPNPMPEAEQQSTPLDIMNPQPRGSRGSLADGSGPALPSSLLGERELPKSGTFSPGQRASGWTPLAVAAIAILIVSGSLRLAIQRHPLEKDSPDFQRALRFWFPLLYQKDPSPRAIKRFLNRVRYLAMRQRGQAPRTKLGHRLREVLRLREPLPAPAQGRGQAISEDVLVALGAIDLLAPDWLMDRAQEGFALDGFLTARGAGENHSLGGDLDVSRRFDPEVIAIYYDLCARAPVH